MVVSFCREYCTTTIHSPGRLLILMAWGCSLPEHKAWKNETEQHCIMYHCWGAPSAGTCPIAVTGLCDCKLQQALGSESLHETEKGARPYFYQMTKQHQCARNVTSQLQGRPSFVRRPHMTSNSKRLELRHIYIYIYIDEVYVYRTNPWTPSSNLLHMLGSGLNSSWHQEALATETMTHTMAAAATTTAAVLIAYQVLHLSASIHSKHLLAMWLSHAAIQSSRIKPATSACDFLKETPCSPCLPNHPPT